jgi:hypothetical protein
MNFPMKVHGLIAATLSTPEKGLWYDSDKDLDDLEEGWGAVAQLWAGWVIRPYTKPKYWFSKDVPSKWNEWDSTHHGLIKFWFPLCPFVSACAGRFGFYVGFKVWNLEKDKYAQMVGIKNIGEGNRALTLSATIRRTRAK